MVLAVITASGGLSGCIFGGGGTKASGEAAEVVLPRVSRGLHWVGEVAPAGSTLSEVARGLGTAIDTGTNIKAQFEKIAASEDPWGEALLTATCYGLENIAEQHRQNNDVLPASAQSWEDFLNKQVAVLLPDKVGSEIRSRVSQFNNAAQLASIQPRAAYIYVRDCALRRG
jgi:hypothetical protein